MERIIISLVFISLNVGLYIVFILSDRLHVSKKVKILFFSVFLVISIIGLALNNPYFVPIRLSISLLLFYVVVFLMYKYFFLKSLEYNKMSFPESIKQIFKFIFLPVFTLFVTTVQMLMLFEII
jgi:hypothetical protein